MAEGGRWTTSSLPQQLSDKLDAPPIMIGNEWTGVVVTVTVTVVLCSASTPRPSPSSTTSGHAKVIVTLARHGGAEKGGEVLSGALRHAGPCNQGLLPHPRAGHRQAVSVPHLCHNVIIIL